MYKLIRVDDEFSLIEAGHRPDPDTPPAPALPVPTRHPFLHGLLPLEKQTWENFVRSGSVEPGAISPSILESWKRCQQAGVEFAGGRCQDFLSAKDLEKRLDQLRGVADPVMETIYHGLRGFGFVVVLIHRDGYILKSVGDIEPLRRAEKFRFGPGANWSELSVGTNAIGTALALGRPIQVSGPEHYNDGHHLWTCAATPIWDPNQGIIGCLDISGPRENADLRILEMAISAGRAIEERLRLEFAHDQALRTNNFMNMAIDSVSDGVISVNSRGIINRVNRSATRLFGVSGGELLGKRLDNTLPFADQARLFQKNADGRPEIVSLPTKTGNRRLMVAARSVPEEYGAGAVITFSEIPRSSSAAPPEPGLTARYTFQDIIGDSPPLREAVRRGQMAARSLSNVLILGGSGTGKEVFAQAIHQAGLRSRQPFVSINCGAIPKELIQSELFGYSEGAFTGARRGGRKGKLVLASGGTLFLDEIGDMPLELQANLLRVLEEKTFLPVGGDKPISADFRLMAATNRGLDREVKAGRFREDLYYRLNVVVIGIPALKDRGDDVRLLADYHLDRLARVLGRTVRRVDPAVMDLLAAHDWPGNVRELINVLEQAINFMPEDELLPQHLPLYTQACPPPKHRPAKPEILPLSTVEKQAIEHALAQCRNNISRVAQALGIGRNTLYSKIKKYKIHLDGLEE